MPIVEVALRLPADLASGITAGSLVREGGVVRNAVDKRIVAHLREAGFVAQNSAVGLQAGIALIQVAGLAMIERHLQRIEARVEELATVSHRTLESVKRFERRQWAEVGKSFEAALQFLVQHRHSTDIRDLEAARMHLIRCRSAIRHQISTNTVEDLLAMGAQTEWLLRLDLDCAAAEVHVYHRLSAKASSEVIGSLQEHRKSFALFSDQLAELAPVRKRLPSRDMIDASDSGNPYATAARWSLETGEVIDALDCEIDLQAILGTTPSSTLQDAESSLLKLKDPFVVVRTELPGS